MTNKRDLIQGTVERRFVAITTDFEFRASGDNKLHFEGYASLFDTPYEMYGGPDKGGWTETVNQSAFKRTLAAKPDVVLNMNHGQGGTGMPMARTTSGTLNLRTDSKGLLPSSDLDLRDPDVQALQVKVERGDVNQMSFAFRTISDLWTNEEANRELMELSLDRGDVSIVTNGAQPKTTVSLRGWDEALAALIDMDPEEALAEIRSAGHESLDDLVRAHTNLGQLITSMKPAETKGPLTLAQARRVALLDSH
jgi:HK97 family phage prohead protease